MRWGVPAIAGLGVLTLGALLLTSAPASAPDASALGPVGMASSASTAVPSPAAHGC